MLSMQICCFHPLTSELSVDLQGPLVKSTCHRMKYVFLSALPVTTKLVASIPIAPQQVSALQPGLSLWQSPNVSRPSLPLCACLCSWSLHMLFILPSIPFSSSFIVKIVPWSEEAKLYEIPWQWITCSVHPWMVVLAETLCAGKANPCSEQMPILLRT